jgi:hypothetical protein
LEEFRCSVDVQEEPVIQALYLAGVSRPHDKSELVQIPLFLAIEELGKTTDLLVLLLIE